MASKTGSSKSKAKYICAECKEEFTGSECPQCGNRKGNLKLAPDGIDQQAHRAVFNLDDVRPLEDLYDNERLLRRRQAEMQLDELEDNLRRAYLLKSQIRLDELEMEKKKREAELKRIEQALSDDTVTPAQPAYQKYAPQQPQQPEMPLFSFSPQQAFLTQLMKMDKEKRQEFIEQLSEADPQALATLSAMLTPYTPQPYPYSYPPPPYFWFAQQAQQQQQPQQPQRDPVEIASGLVSTLFDMLERSRPRTDESLKEAFRDLREELKRIQDRVERVVESKKDNKSDLAPLLQKIENLEKRLNDTARKPSVLDTLRELKDLMTELENTGLAVRPDRAGKTVDDELKLKEFEFKKEQAEKEAELKRKQIEAENAKAEVARGLLSALLKRSLRKAQEEAQETQSRTPPAHNRTSSGSGSTSSKSREPVVIEEHHTDSGVVKETRPPSKKSEGD